MEKLSDLGEREVIRRIRGQYGYSWPDDDAAYIDMGRYYLLVTTDAISQSSHMPRGAGWDKIGYFFVALNLSDIAAMGGRPEYFVSALTLPPDMKLKYLVAFERGARRCLEKYGVKLIGGDTKQGREMNLAGTAIGRVKKGMIVRRYGARRGDVLCVTGKLGKNGAGYYMWKKHGSRRWAEMLLDIDPRIKEGIAMSRYGATSAIDLSDGLFSAVAQLSEASECGLDVYYDKVPVHPAAIEVSRKLGIDIEDVALNFGGEYELLFTMPRERFRKFMAYAKRNHISAVEIGKVVGSGCTLILDGKRNRIIKKGYEHFK